MYGVTIDGAAATTAIVIILRTVYMAKNEEIDIRSVIYRFDNGIFM